MEPPSVRRASLALLTSCARGQSWRWAGNGPGRPPQRHRHSTPRTIKRAGQSQHTPPQRPCPIQGVPWLLLDTRLQWTGLERVGGRAGLEEEGREGEEGGRGAPPQATAATGPLCSAPLPLDCRHTDGHLASFCPYQVLVFRHQKIKWPGRDLATDQTGRETSTT